MKPTLAVEGKLLKLSAMGHIDVHLAGLDPVPDPLQFLSASGNVSRAGA